LRFLRLGAANAARSESKFFGNLYNCQAPAGGIDLTPGSGQEENLDFSSAVTSPTADF
jgi:hypothetical protein